MRLNSSSCSAGSEEITASLYCAPDLSGAFFFSGLGAAEQGRAEETGVKNARLVSEEILSLEILTVEGHVKKGKYVPSHLHLNVTYLAEADEDEVLKVNEEENQAVKWWPLEEALKVSKEPWMVEHIYKKYCKGE